MASNLQSSINQVLGTAVAGKKADELVQAKAKQEEEHQVRMQSNATKQAILDERLKGQQYNTEAQRQKILTQKKKKSQANLQRQKVKLSLDRLKERVSQQKEKQNRVKASLQQGGYINGNN